MIDRLSPHAQVFLDRINQVDYISPPWNEGEVVEAMRDQYLLIQHDMPKVEIAPDLYEAFKLADLYEYDKARQGMFDLMVADATIDGERMNEALDLIYSQPVLRAVYDKGIEMQMLSGLLSQNFETTIAHAGLTAAILHQRGFSALTPSARHFASVCLQELEALENGLGWYFATKDKLILTPLTPIEVRDIHSL